MLKGLRPDLTPAQLVAVVSWIVAQAVAYGYLDARYQQLAVSIGATVLASVWHLADAHLRGKRNMAQAISGTTTPPETTVKA